MPTPDAATIAALLPMAPRDYLILFALADGPLHGHGLLKFLEAEARGVPFDPANLYRSLRKLERDALVVETRAAADRQSGPPRRSYRLTRLGSAALGAEANRLSALVEAARVKKLVAAKSR
jgi:DNA-binding PadR family transcriptional regulator